MIFAGNGGEDRGKVVILGHRLPGGRHLQTLYAHLSKVEVARGSLVARGEELGRIGRSEVRDPARLRFEIYEGALIDPGFGRAPHELNRLDPTATIAAHRPADPANLAPEPLGVYEVVRQVFRIGPGDQW